jgi:8-oxo-dGTP pyrophosphatase MutT (NUDIX family)
MISSGLPIRRAMPKHARLPRVSKVRECEQVAAVCYRIRKGAIEFLLVQTRGSRRWIFPKGSAEPGLTHAQAAAIEAFEEAGVHGRIEEISFARYFSRRQNGRRSARRSATPKSLLVSAHLCEVRRLGNPKEPNRNRTWFSIEDTKQRLREGRKDDDGNEFERVVQQAAIRIKQLGGTMDAPRDQPNRYTSEQDELHKVQFEASAETRRLLNQAGRIVVAVGRDRDKRVLPCEVLPFATPRPSNRTPRLLSSGVKVKALAASTRNG